MNRFEIILGKDPPPEPLKRDIIIDRSGGIKILPDPEVKDLRYPLIDEIQYDLSTMHSIFSTPMLGSDDLDILNRSHLKGLSING